MKTTQSKFAEMEGVSKQRVGQWVRDGIITLDEHGKVDVERARDQLAKRLDFPKRMEWEAAFNKKVEPKKAGEVITDYTVQKRFQTKIDGFDNEKFIVPKGTIMRVYGRKGSTQVEIAFFPAEGKR